MNSKMIITTENEYEEALNMIDEIFDADENSSVFKELLNLINAVEEYESIHYPILKTDDIKHSLDSSP